MAETSVVAVDVERRAGYCTSFELGFIPLGLLMVDQGCERTRGIKKSFGMSNWKHRVAVY